MNFLPLGLCTYCPKTHSSNTFSVISLALAPKQQNTFPHLAGPKKAPWPSTFFYFLKAPALFLFFLSFLFFFFLFFAQKVPRCPSEVRILNWWFMILCYYAYFIGWWYDEIIFFLKKWWNYIMLTIGLWWCYFRTISQSLILIDSRGGTLNPVSLREDRDLGKQHFLPSFFVRRYKYKKFPAINDRF